MSDTRLWPCALDSVIYNGGISVFDIIVVLENQLSLSSVLFFRLISGILNGFVFVLQDLIALADSIASTRHKHLG